jgi:Cys-rich repeat protein
MTKREACPRAAAHGLGWSVVMVGLLAGCADSGPRLQLQVPRAPRSSSALGSATTPSVPANATFDAPVIDANSWNGTPIGTGSFSVALTPTASGGPSSIAFTAPQGTDRYVMIGDFNSSTRSGLALISDTAWVVGANALNGTTKTAVVFDTSNGNVTGIARVGTVTLTAAGTSLGQRVTGSLSASFVPYSAMPGCAVDADCSPGEVCRGGQCVRATPPGCSASSQCAAGQSCQSGACVQSQPQDAGPGPSCLTDRDCGVNQGCNSGQCVAVAPGCTANAQCAPGEACVGGACVTSNPGCTSNAQCAAGQACVGGACVTSNPGCTANAQCAPGEACVGGACVTSNPGCTSNAQCAAGQSCIGGACVTSNPGCTSSAQCPRGLVCHAGACVSSGPTVCAPKQGSGSYLGSFGSVNTCSALGSGAVSLSAGGAAIDDDNGQLTLFIVDPATQRDGVIIELNACPAAAGSTTGLQAALYQSQQTPQGVVFSAMVPGTASIQWTQVGTTLAGTVSLSFVTGGTVTGSFSVQ